MAIPAQDGRVSLGSDKVHLESIRPGVTIPVSVDDSPPLEVTIAGPDPLPVDGSGVTQPVSGTVTVGASSFPIVVSDIAEAVRFGIITGYSTTSKFGRNLSIDTGVTADVWSVGGVRTWLSTAVTLEILSASGDDSSAGSGAQQITVQGLDANWDDQEATVLMNGVTPVTLTGTTWRRINRMFVSRMGTYGGSNAGIITLRIASAGATQANIIAGKGQTEQTHWSLARNKTAALQMLYISTDSSKVIDAEVFQNSGISDVTTPFVGAKRKIWGITGLQGSTQHDYAVYTLLVGPCDVWWEATSHANGTEVEAGFDILIKDD
jgi:hypothetical protein